MSHSISSVLTRVRRFSALGAIQRSLVAGVVLFATSSAWAFQTSSTVTSGGSRTTNPLTGGSKHAPEINPALIVGAVVLLLGGILILTSRRRRVAGASES